MFALLITCMLIVLAYGGCSGMSVCCSVLSSFSRERDVMIVWAHVCDDVLLLLVELHALVELE